MPAMVIWMKTSDAHSFAAATVMSGALAAGVLLADMPGVRAQSAIDSTAGPRALDYSVRGQAVTAPRRAGDLRQRVRARTAPPAFRPSGPVELDTRLRARSMPHDTDQGFAPYDPNKARQAYKRGPRGLGLRLPDIKQRYYRYDLWPHYDGDFYSRDHRKYGDDRKDGYKYSFGYHYGQGKPYTPYFSNYFKPFENGHFRGHFQY